MGSKHKINLSQSSASSSEDGSSNHAQAAQPTMSRWERLRRPSAASSTKRPQFSDASRSSSTVTSPNAPHFPLPSPIGGPSQDMMRTTSDDSYMHILAASTAARKAAIESGAPPSDTASVMSFTCSLSKEFDRQRTDVTTLNASSPDLPAAMAPQMQSRDNKQAWLDTTFHKLSARYRAPKKGAIPKGTAVRPAKPHFLDLSSIICPTPAATERSGSTEDEGDAGDRSSSSSSSFHSGPDSSFEAMSGWDYSSADTSLDLRTPQAEEDRQLAANAYDFTTPRPSQMQRFASAQSAATSSGTDMRLPSPPIVSPLMPNFALPSSTASTPGFAPPSMNGGYGFPMAPQQMARGVTLDDIHHKPSSILIGPTREPVLAPPAAAPGTMRQLRKQKSFDNSAELRRRQKQEWSVGGPKPPGFGVNPTLTIGVPNAQQALPPAQRGPLSPQQAMSPRSAPPPLDARRQDRQGPFSPPSYSIQLPCQGSFSPSGHLSQLPGHGPIHSRVAQMQARPPAMQRGMSHDTAGTSLQHHTANAPGIATRSPPKRPGLVPRNSSGALYTLDNARTAVGVDPASSTGFSDGSSQQRQDYHRPGSDRRQPVQLPVTSPVTSPITGSVPLPPLLPATSRESFGSSVSTESMPPTPHSATFLRGLPLSAVEESAGRIKVTPSSLRDIRLPRELHHMQNPSIMAQGALPMTGSALGLMPGKLVRAYSDSPFGMPSQEAGRVRMASRLRSESISSEHDGGDERDNEMMRRNAYGTQATPRQKLRPELRREHTSNAIMVSPARSKAHRRPDYAEGMKGEPASASASITPRSSNLKDLLAVQSQSADEQRQEPTASAARASLDSDCSDSSLAYTKPSPLLQQGFAPASSNENHLASDGASTSSSNITPTNSYRTDLAGRNAATPTAAYGSLRSQWTPDNSPTGESALKASTIGASQANRQRANLHADEWAANLRKLTARGGGNQVPTAVGK